MNLKSLKKLVKKNLKIEGWVRTFISFIPYKFRKLDKEFWRYYHFLFEIEKWPFEKVREYQFEQLKKIVEDAYNHSIFYKRKFDAAGFYPNQLISLDDIKKIPQLTKDEVREHSDELVLDNQNKMNLIEGPTSGTTGKALMLYFDKDVVSREWASICYQWSRVGYKPGDGRIELRGFIEQDVDFIYMPDERVLRVNLVKLSEQNLQLVVNQINKLGYKFIHGYPSAVFKLAVLLKKTNISFHPKAIMMASEPLYDWQLQIIDGVFSCPKIIHYGLAEKVALGAWNLDRSYHFIPAYGIVEYDPNNKELIGTSLINEVMPLIRYRVTDTIGDFKDSPVELNRSLFPVIEQIFGREEDNTFNDKGGVIPPALVTFPFKYLRYIENAKIVQLAIGKFDLIFETKYNLDFLPLAQEVDGIVINLKKVYGELTEFNIVLTDKIPINSSGKFRWIECRVHA